MHALRSLLSTVAAALLLAAAVPGAVHAQDDLKAKYEEKLSHEFIPHGGWITDYDQARTRARDEGKVLFVYFSRSYAP